MALKIFDFKIPDLKLPKLPEVNLPEVDFPKIPKPQIPEVSSDKAIEMVKEKFPELADISDQITSMTDVDSMIPDDIVPDIDSMIPDIKIDMPTLDMSSMTSSMNMDQFKDMGIDTSEFNLDMGDIEDIDIQSQMDGMDIEEMKKEMDIDSLKDEMDIKKMLPGILFGEGADEGFGIDTIKEKLSEIKPEDVANFVKNGVIRYVEWRKEMAIMTVTETKKFASHIDTSQFDFKSVDGLLNTDYKTIFKHAFRDYLYEKLDDLDASMDMSTMMDSVGLDDISKEIDFNELTNSLNSMDFNFDTSEMESIEGMDMQMPSFDMNTIMPEINIDMSSLDMSSMNEQMNMDNMKIGDQIKEKLDPYLN